MPSQNMNLFTDDTLRSNDQFNQNENEPFESMENGNAYYEDMPRRMSVSSVGGTNGSAFENSDSDNFFENDMSTMIEKKRKRNEMESGRRQRLNEKFDELRYLIQGPKRRKDILESAIETIYDLSDRINALEQERIHQERYLQLQSSNAVMESSPDIFSSRINAEIIQAQIFLQLPLPVVIISIDGLITSSNACFTNIIRNFSVNL